MGGDKGEDEEGVTGWMEILDYKCEICPGRWVCFKVKVVIRSYPMTNIVSCNFTFR